VTDRQVNVKVAADAQGFNSALDSATNRITKYAAQTGRAKEVLATFQKALDESGASTAKQVQAIAKATTQLDRMAQTAGKTQAQLAAVRAEQLGAATAFGTYTQQIADATSSTHGFSLASSSARRELLVLAHEASQGNFTRFAGSLGVLAERTDALGAILSPTGVGIGLFAAALAAAAVDVYKVTSAISELDHASAATNGYLGLTNDQLSAMAQQLAGANGGLVATTETMTALTRTGAASSSTLAELTGVVTQFGKDAGLSADKAAEAFTKMLDDPKKGMAELQAQYHMFSSAQIEVIDGYIKTGDTAKATQAFIDAVAESQHRMAAQGEQDVGLLTKLWRSFADAAKQAGDNFDRMGVAATNAEKLTDALARQSAAQRNLAQAKAMPFGNTGSAQADLDAANAQVAALQKVQAAQQKIASDNASRAKSGDSKIAVDSYLGSSQYASPSLRHDQELSSENAAFAKATADLNKTSADYLAALKRHYENVEQINAEYSKKTKTHANENGLNTQLASLTTQNAALEEQRRAALAQAKADYQTGSKDYTEYYQAILDANAKYLDAELANAQRRVDIAGAKKEGAAQQEALKVWQALVAQRLAAEQDYTASLAKYAALRAASVNKYADQQSSGVQKQADGYNQQSDTRYMTATQKSNYDAELQIRDAYYQEVDQLKQKYGDTPLQDQQEYQDKLLLAAQGFAQHEQLLQQHMAQVADINNSYSDQMHTALTALGGDAKSNAQLAGEAFTSTWQTASNALDTFLTTGKGNFDQFAASILSDLAKIALHAAEMQVFQSLGTMAFSTGGAVGNYATGGAIVGAGTGTSDSIPAMLSNGEYVIKAAQAKKYGSLLESINNGGVSHFASGGAVGSVSFSAGSSGGGPVSVTVHNSGGGGLSDTDAKELHTVVQAFVDRRIDQKMRGQGGYAYKMKYGQV
jgi:lambda family phage tail tape measure protein